MCLCHQQKELSPRPLTRYTDHLYTVEGAGGLSIEPRGTPHFISQDSELTPLNSTYCCLLLRYLLNYLSAVPRTP